MTSLLLLFGGCVVCAVIAARRQQHPTQAAHAATALPPVHRAPASREELETYFRDPAQFADKPFDKVVAAVGMWDDCDDWDWGRLVHEWRRPGLRVRVVQRGGEVRCVEFLDPSNTDRFAPPIEVIWDPYPRI